MLDISLLLSALGTSAILFGTLVARYDLSFDQVAVFDSWKDRSHPEIVLTRDLLDEMRLINNPLVESRLNLDLGSAGLSDSLLDMESFPVANEVFGSLQSLLGYRRYHVVSDVRADHDGLLFTGRIYSPSSQGGVAVVTVRGNPDDTRAMMREAALQILTRISPYVVAKYDLYAELAGGELEFPKTRRAVALAMATQPNDVLHVGYTITGNIHLIRAELLTGLSDDARRSELNAAIELLQAARAQAPDFMPASMLLAEAYSDRSEFALADQYYARAVALDPDRLETRLRWAGSLADQGRTREAIFQLVAAVELSPADAGLRERLARLYAAMGRPEEAREQWRKAREVDPLHKLVAESAGMSGPD